MDRADLPAALPDAPPAADTRLGATLGAVSRSFYLSIRLLPAPLRAPVGTGYLLARAADTLADTSGLPASERAAWLQALVQLVEADVPDEAAARALSRACAPHQQDRHERALLESLHACLLALAALPAADHADVRTVLQHITTGQAEDLARFADPRTVTALPDAAALERYTYQVAGSVGEFWTTLCLRHLRSFSSLDAAQLMPLARRYGMGLQLINILRDAGDDLRAGRCYLPADALAAAGLTPGDILARPQALDDIYRHWLARADECLDDGMAYVRSVQPRRVRAATALPALIGAQTLALLRQAGTGALQQHVKVPRAQVRTLLWRLALSGAAQGTLQAQYQRAGG